MAKIVSFSGGKDSTAMLLGMVERGMPIDHILYVDMGDWEFPQMSAHIDKVEQFIDRPIERLQLAKPMNYWLYQHPHLNSEMKGYGWSCHWLRWCTREKVQRFRKEIDKSDTIYLGYAADETRRNRPLWEGQNFCFECHSQYSSDPKLTLIAAVKRFISAHKGKKGVMGLLDEIVTEGVRDSGPW